MNKLKQLTIICLFVFVSLFFSDNVYAFSEPYVITDYDVDIIVNEDNSYYITENISVYFNESRHGIIRSIPIKNRVDRLDGTVSYNRARISNIEANGVYRTYTEGNNRMIKLGDPDVTLTGSEKYTISYLYNLGRDTGEGYDEFYFDIIGSLWDTTISNITFNITFPKDFDESKIGFSSGVIESTTSSNVNFEVNGNTITGRFIGTLNSYEALTIRLELPEGYYVYKIDLMMVLAVVIPILLALLSLYLWYKYGRDERVIETVEFYPPSGFNSAELAFQYDGETSQGRTMSLLIYLANKGYIKIVDIDKIDPITKQKEYKIVKLNEYDGNNVNEKIFLNGLFRSKLVKEKISSTDLLNDDREPTLSEVTKEDLLDSFYATIRKININIGHKEEKYKIFERTSLDKWPYLAISLIVIVSLITVRPMLEYGDIDNLPFALIFTGLGLYMLSGVFSIVPIPNDKLSNRIFALIFTLLFGGMPFYFWVLPAILISPVYINTYIIGFICIYIVSSMMFILPKRTPYGTLMFGKISGFRNFLKTVEKDKLEQLVMQDPTYFYNILPYTYALGVSDKWIKKFETIAIQAPEWYQGSSSFDVSSFGNFVGSTMSSATSTTTSSSGSDGGSGGGSSGGGSGGGGGSSW